MTHHDDMWRIAISNPEFQRRYDWQPPKHKARPDAGGQISQPRTKPLTESSPEYRNWHDSNVWGALAPSHGGGDTHNPFLHGHSEGTRDQHEPSDVNEDGLHEGHEGWHSWYHNNPATHERARKRIQSQVNQSHPCIRIGTDALHGVLDSGRFKTQFETNSSGGSVDPWGREATEQSHFGYPESEEDEDENRTAHHPDHARPIYGYLAHDPVANRQAHFYGDHTVVLHKPTVWHRTTASIGDSLGREYKMTPSPVQKMQPHAANFEEWSGTHQERQEDNWHDDPSGAELHRQLTNMTKGYTVDNDYTPHRNRGEYTEAQYHGGVKDSDIHYAILRDGARSNVEPHLKRRLNEKGIPWIHVNGSNKIVDHNGLSKEATLSLSALGYHL